MASPTVVRRYTAVSSTTNSSSFTPSWTRNLNTAISAGRSQWLCEVTADGNPTLTTSSTGWRKVGQASDATNAVTVALFEFIGSAAYAAGSEPAIVISSTASEQYSATMIAVIPSSGSALGVSYSASAQGSSTNSNPPAVTNNSGASRDCLVVAFRGGDSTVTASGAPTNYGNLQTIAGGGSNGASSNSAERSITIAAGGTEDPGTFTSNTEQWVSYSVALYDLAAANTLTDDFDDDSRDTAKWGLGQVRDSAATATGVTVSETNQRVEVTGPSGVNANRISGYLSVEQFDLYNSEIVFKLPNHFNITDVDEAYAGIGVDAANSFYVNFDYFALTTHRLGFRYRIADSETTSSTYNTSATDSVWIRLRHNASDDTIKIDTATTSASDPPSSGDWTNRTSVTRPAAVPTYGFIGFGARVFTTTSTPTTFQFDGFNVATSSGPATQPLTPSLFTNSASFPAATVSPGAVDLTPSLKASEAVIRSLTVVSTYALTASLLADGDTFHTATVAPGVVTLTASLFGSSASFAAATVAPGAVGLTASLFGSSSTFHTPVTAAGTYPLTAPLVPSAASFPSATVTATRALTAALFTNSATHFTPTMSADGGEQALTAGLFSNAANFATATVAATYGLAPSLKPSENAFASATITTSKTLTASLVASANAFHAASIGGLYALAPALLANGSTFHSGTVAASANLSVALAANSTTFHSATVFAAGAPQSLLPGLFTNAVTFPSATVGGLYALAPALAGNVQSFHSPAVSSANPLSPVALPSGAAFHSAAVSTQYALVAQQYAASASHYVPAVTAANDLAPGLVSNSPAFTTPTVAAGATELAVPLYANDNEFYALAIFGRADLPASQARTATQARPRTAATAVTSRVAASVRSAR